MKKLTFSLEATKFSLVLRWTPAVPNQAVFRLRINTFLVGKILLLFHQKTALCCVLIFWIDRVKIKLRGDALLKFLFKLRLKRETNLMQACSANYHQVIMPSWLPKVPSWLRKNILCLSQSAFSNFALHVTITWMSNVKEVHCKPSLHVPVNLLFGGWPPSCVTPPVVVAVVVVVVCTRPRAIPLVMITMRKSIALIAVISGLACKRG